MDVVEEVLEHADGFAGVPSTVEDVLASEAVARAKAHDVMS